MTYEPTIYTIKVNGVEMKTAGAPDISYEALCGIAKKDPAHNPTVVYTTNRPGDEQRAGSLRHGQTTRLEDGMIFDCLVTGNG